MTDESVQAIESTQSTVSTSVLVRARTGDEAAFQKIEQLVGGLVYHWCRSRGLKPPDAEDVVQDVFLTVARSIGDFRRDSEKQSFRAWLFVITKTKIIDHHRRNAGREFAAGGNDDVAQQAAIEESDDYCHAETLYLLERALEIMVAEFSPRDCEAFLLVVRDGLTAKEAAQKLNMSVNSVYIAKSRILKRVRDDFGDVLDDPHNTHRFED